MRTGIFLEVSLDVCDAGSTGHPGHRYEAPRHVTPLEVKGNELGPSPHPPNPTPIGNVAVDRMTPIGMSLRRWAGMSYGIQKVITQFRFVLFYK